MADRFPSRRPRPIALATVGVLLATVACTNQAARHASAGAPRSGGSLTFAVNGDPVCIDPQQSPSGTTQLAVRGVVDSLVAQDPRTGRIVPWLATSWTVSPDARRFTFVLRSGVTFSDGRPVDAAAVKANFDRIVDPGTRSQFAVSLLQGYAGSTVVNPHTVTVSFTTPSAPFLQAASTAFLGIESPASFAAGPAATCRRIVGSGPFTLSRYTPRASVLLRRRPGYAWPPSTATHHGGSYLDSVTITIVPEDSVRVGSLRSGQVDAIAAVPPRQVDRLRHAGLTVTRVGLAGVPFSLIFNHARPPLDDVRVRRAVSRAIDADQIVHTLYHGIYPRARGLLTPPTPGYTDPTGGRDTFDPDQARTLLDQAGWTGRDSSGYRTRNGHTLTIDWPYNTPTHDQSDVLAQLVQQQLKRVGVKLVLRPLATGAALSTLAKGDYDITQQSFGRADGDVLRNFFLSTSRDNFSHVALPDVDALLTRGAGTTDPARRDALYGQVLHKLYEDATAFPMYDIVSLVGTSNRIGGLHFTDEGLPVWHDMWIANG